MSTYFLYILNVVVQMEWEKKSYLKKSNFLRVVHIQFCCWILINFAFTLFNLFAFLSSFEALGFQTKFIIFFVLGVGGN